MDRSGPTIIQTDITTSKAENQIHPSMSITVSETIFCDEYLSLLAAWVLNRYIIPTSRVFLPSQKKINLHLYSTLSCQRRRTEQYLHL